MCVCVCAMAKLLLSCGLPEGQPRCQLLRSCWCSLGGLSLVLFIYRQMEIMVMAGLLLGSRGGVKDVGEDGGGGGGGDGGETDVKKKKKTGEAEDVVRPASTALINTNKLERSPR